MPTKEELQAMGLLDLNSIPNNNPPPREALPEDDFYANANWNLTPTPEPPMNVFQGYTTQAFGNVPNQEPSQPVQVNQASFTSDGLERFKQTNTGSKSHGLMGGISPIAMGLLNAGASMLANSGYSRIPKTNGQVVGAGLQAGLQGMLQGQAQQRLMAQEQRSQQNYAMQMKPYQDRENSINSYASDIQKMYDRKAISKREYDILSNTPATEGYKLLPAVLKKHLNSSDNKSGVVPKEFIKQAIKDGYNFNPNVVYTYGKNGAIVPIAKHGMGKVNEWQSLKAKYGDSYEGVSLNEIPGNSLKEKYANVLSSDMPINSPLRLRVEDEVDKSQRIVKENSTTMNLRDYNRNIAGTDQRNFYVDMIGKDQVRITYKPKLYNDKNAREILTDYNQTAQTLDSLVDLHGLIQNPDAVAYFSQGKISGEYKAKYSRARTAVQQAMNLGVLNNSKEFEMLFDAIGDLSSLKENLKGMSSEVRKSKVEHVKAQIEVLADNVQSKLDTQRSFVEEMGHERRAKPYVNFLESINNVEEATNVVVPVNPVTYDENYNPEDDYNNFLNGPR